MDLIPRPNQLLAAAGNLVRALRHGGFSDTRPMPRTALDGGTSRDGSRCRVYRYHPDPGAAPSGDPAPSSGDPVLLVAPLGAPPTCYDLRRGCSLIEFLVARGRAVYLVEYGDLDLADRSLSIGDWIDDVLPDAVRAVSADAGGRSVHLVGWSLGGILALLTAADQPGLSVASVVSVGAPYDVDAVPPLAPARPLLSPTGAPGLIKAGYRVLGAVGTPLGAGALRPIPLLGAAAGPLLRLPHLDDAEFLAHLEAVDRFTAATHYPGRGFGQVYHRFLGRGSLTAGGFDVGERTIDLAGLAAPALVTAGANDEIAPADSVRAVLPLLTGAPEARFEIVPGGHLGQLTGRGARDALWVSLDEWLDEWAG